MKIKEYLTKEDVQKLRSLGCNVEDILIDFGITEDKISVNILMKILPGYIMKEDKFYYLRSGKGLFYNKHWINYESELGDIKMFDEDFHENFIDAVFNLIIYMLKSKLFENYLYK